MVKSNPYEKLYHEIARPDYNVNTAAVVLYNHDHSFEIRSEGAWDKQHLHGAIIEIEKILTLHQTQNVLWDFRSVECFDSAGMILVIDAIGRFMEQGGVVSCVNMKPEHQRMLVFYRKNYSKPAPPSTSEQFGPLAKLGRSTITAWHGLQDFLSFLGETTIHGLRNLRHPGDIRFSSIIKHIDYSGVRALPIVALTAFLIGLVIAYQGAEQLEKFGANIFIVEMSAIAIFRELAPLITAIVIAGRSASSYTAEIGTMKMTEEIDAMKTMGFPPHHFLVLPRIYALMLALPLIVFFADMVGMLGSMLIAKYQLGIGFTEYLQRLYAEVPIKHLFIGLIKAPFYGAIIALIGCYRGFQVTGSTDSIGIYTTISVVNAIFWVIATNALISILLTEVGI